MNNTLKRLLSLAMAVALVMTCGVMPVSADEGESSEHTHVWADGSCTVEGCGATCDHAGATVTETAPTCAKPGAKTSTCGTCGMTLSTETIPATGAHVYDETTGLCACGAVNPNLPAEVDDEEEDEETPHTCNFSEEVSDTATCTAPGVKTMKCACGQTQEVESPAKGHAYGDGTVTTEPTCANAGVLTKTCGCGETTTETIPATGNHNYVDGTCTVCTAAEPVVCDGTENCPADEHNEDCLCYDWCVAHGCDQDNGIHLEGCPYTIPCDKTEGCELHKGHWGDCTGMDTFEGEVVAKIGDSECGTLADALNKASAMTGDVTVEIYDKVTLNTSLSGSYSSIKFVGKDTDAEIYLEVQGYITATGKTVSFEDLILSKSSGGYIGNAGFMNVAFGIYDVTEVNYTNCTFANGAYASSGNVTFNNCTFKRSYDKYGLWAYGNVNCTVNGGKFDDYRGIKMYAEGRAKTTALTVNGVDFTAVSDKPAIVLTFGKSVTLTGENKFPSTGVFELDADGAPDGTPVTANIDDIACVYEKQDEMLDCGVLVDGKIYTTITAATDVITPDSTVTLMYETEEEVSLPYGVTLNKNGNTAANVTISVLDTEEELKAAIAKGGTITLEGDITLTETLTIPADKTVTLNLNNHNITGGLQANTSEKHIYVIDNYGTLTIEGTGTISGRGTQNYGTMTIEDGVTINSVDANGGACVWNYNGSKLTINGGNFNAANEGNGTSGPACIHGYESFELDINGGTFTSTAKLVYAICANGTTTIDSANVTGVHGAIAVNSGSATIGSGTYSISGVDAQTDHCIYVPEGASVTISNGSFTGDNGEAGGKVLYVAGTATVTGGTFKKSANSVSDVSEFVALYYKQDPTTGTVNPVPEVKPEAAAPTVSNKVDESTLTTEEKTVEQSITSTNVNNDEKVTGSITNVLNNDENVKQIIENLDTPGATGVEMSLDIERKDVQVETNSATSETTTKLVYDVQPYIQPIDDAENPVGAPTEVNTVSESITFRLPMPNGTKGRVVKVTHDHDGNGHEFFGNYKIQGDSEDKNCYVELSSKQFSEYVVEILPESVSTISTEVSGTPYATLADALANAKSGDIIKFKENITLTGAHEMKVPAGVTIDGAGNTLTVDSVYHGSADALFYSDGAFNVKNLTIHVNNAGDSGDKAISLARGGTVDNVTIEGAVSHGIYIEDGNASITNSEFSNSGYGIYSEEAPTGTVTITNNEFTSTRAAVLRSNETFSGNTVSSVKGVSVAAPNATITDNTFTGDRALSISGSGSTSTITGNSFSTTTKVETEVDADLSNNYWGSANGPSASQLAPQNANATITVNSYYTDDDMKQDDLTAGDDAVAYYNGVYYDDLNDAAEAANGQPIYLVLSNPSTTTLTYPATIDNLGLNGTLGVSLSTEASVTVTSSGEVVIAPPANVVGYYPFISLKYGKDSVDVQAIFVEPGTKLSITSTTSEFDDAAFSGEFMKDLNKKDGLDKGDFKAYFPTYDNRYVKGTDETLIVESTGFFGTCLQIFVDDIEVYDAADKYEKSGVDVKVGCTRLELTSKFLKTLSTGDYTVTFVHKLGNETFKVSETIKIRDDSSKADPTNPKTGDFILMPMAIMTLSAAALAVLLSSKKKHA